LLVQYFTSKTRSLGRTSSSGQTRLTNDQERQQIATDNTHYHDEGITIHMMGYPPVTNPVASGNHHVTNGIVHENYVLRYVFL